jgi:large subunit ribosomal protein L14e
MFKVGRVCKKTKGREAGRFCVVIEKKDENFVLIDGDVRRRKCNINHLKPVGTVVKVAKKAGTEVVRKAMEDAGFKMTPKTKPKPPKEKPVKKRVLKSKERAATKEPKKPVKKPAAKKKPVKKAPAKKRAAPKKPAKKKPAAKKTAKKPAKKATKAKK